MPAWLWTHGTSAAGSREAGHGLPRLGKEDLGLVQYHKRMESAAQRRDREVSQRAAANAKRAARKEGKDDAAAQAACTPVYEEMPGWSESTYGARSWADLPANAVKYIRRVEELTKTPVTLLSTSPERDDTILVTDPFGG